VHKEIVLRAHLRVELSNIDSRKAARRSHALSLGNPGTLRTLLLHS
jgi:hypothetical protein